jgi:hypothetical protein
MLDKMAQMEHQAEAVVALIIMVVMEEPVLLVKEITVAPDQPLVLPMVRFMCQAVAVAPALVVALRLILKQPVMGAMDLLLLLLEHQ